MRASESRVLAPVVLLAPIVLLAGLGAWWALATGADGAWARLLLVLGLGAVAAVPVFREGVASALDRLRHPSPALRARVAFGVWVVSVVYLVFTAFHQDRDLIAKVHDEHSYLIQTRMMAAGALWMPRHDCADFFESFHVLTEPVYASIYFPGTALLYAPALWAGQPTWAMPALAAALVIALTYRCVTELLGDGAWGLAAAMVVLGVGMVRTHSVIVMSQVPAALLAMLTVWAYLRWRAAPDARRPHWALLVGAFAGWGAVTRPVDALAFAVPVGVAMLLDLRKRTTAAEGPQAAPEGAPEEAPANATTRATGATPARTRVAVAAALVAGALPFLLLQAVFNRGVTGNFLKTPYVLYLERYQPGSQFGGGGAAGGAGGAGAAPATSLPQKLEYYREFLPSSMRSGPLERLRMTGGAALPTALLLPLVAVGLVGLARGRRWVLGAAAPLFFALYLLNPFYLGHYTVPLAPALAMWAAAGGKALEEAAGSLRRPRAARFLRAWLVPAVAVLALGRLPEIDPTVEDEWIGLPTVRLAHDSLPQTVEEPAVVLFTFRPGNIIHDEPVYNSDVAWPDDAPIVRAHDLGPRNREVIEYYARRQPDRQFYRYDRGNHVVTPLGTAAALAANPGAALQVPPDPTTRPAAQPAAAPPGPPLQPTQ